MKIEPGESPGFAMSSVFLSISSYIHCKMKLKILVRNINIILTIRKMNNIIIVRNLTIIIKPRRRFICQIQLQITYMMPYSD